MFWSAGLLCLILNLSELLGRPSYPGYYLSKVFLPEKDKEVQGTEEKCITWRASYLSGVLLLRVYCIFLFILTICPKILNYLF